MAASSISRAISVVTTAVFGTAVPADNAARADNAKQAPSSDGKPGESDPVANALVGIGKATLTGAFKLLDKSPAAKAAQTGKDIFNALAFKSPAAGAGTATAPFTPQPQQPGGGGFGSPAGGNPSGGGTKPPGGGTAPQRNNGGGGTNGSGGGGGSDGGSVNTGREIESKIPVTPGSTGEKISSAMIAAGDKPLEIKFGNNDTCGPCRNYDGTYLNGKAGNETGITGATLYQTSNYKDNRPVLKVAMETNPNLNKELGIPISGIPHQSYAYREKNGEIGFAKTYEEALKSHTKMHEVKVEPKKPDEVKKVDEPITPKQTPLDKFMTQHEKALTKLVAQKFDGKNFAQVKEIMQKSPTSEDAKKFKEQLSSWMSENKNNEGKIPKIPQGSSRSEAATPEQKFLYNFISSHSCTNGNCYPGNKAIAEGFKRDGTHLFVQDNLPNLIQQSQQIGNDSNGRFAYTQGAAEKGGGFAQTPRSKIQEEDVATLNKENLNTIIDKVVPPEPEKKPSD